MSVAYNYGVSCEKITKKNMKFFFLPSVLHLTDEPPLRPAVTV